MNTVLLVDDNAYIIEALAMTLGRHVPYGNILKALNGREGVDILNSVPVDLILTDINMPVMDGYSLINYRNRHFPHISLMVVTGDTSPDVMQRLNALGITECLEKPFDFDVVSHLILKMLARSHREPTPRIDAVHSVSV